MVSLELPFPQWVSLRSGLNTRSTLRFSAFMTAIRANGLAIFALVLESRAEETTLPPNQTAPPDRSEIVEGQVKGGRDQRQIVGANSCAAFRQVGNIAAACPRLPLEEE